MNRSIGMECRCVSNLVRRKMGETDAIKVSQELTGMHGFVIGYLYNNQQQEVYQKDLEKRFEIRRSTATQMLTLMEKNGLILRQPVPHDARLKKLVLTDKAIELHKQVVKEIETRNIDVVSLCDNLSLNPNEFINLINNPVRNVSLYIEILEEVRNERD